MDLSNRRAVVTGASSGIGLATVKELISAGATVLAVARRSDRLAELCAETQGCFPFVADQADGKFAESTLGEALKVLGGCDIFLNNAGVMVAGSVDEIDLDKVAHMARINVEGAFRTAYVAARFLKAQGFGHLVNTSSILGTKIRPSAGAYAGTKHAIEALSEDLRIQLAGTGVKVTCIEPGLVMTELHKEFKVHPRDGLGVKHPLQPEDVARCIRWVLEQPDHVNIPRLMVTPADQAI